MKKEDNKSLVGSLLLVLLTLLVGAFWLKPNWDEASALGLTLSARQGEQTVLKTKLTELQTAQTAMQDGSEVALETVLAAIPEKFAQDQLITQITGIAKQYDINMSSINFSVPINSVEVLKKATINVSMTGNGDDLLRFLKGLENNARKLIVKSITVQNGTSSGVARVNFNVSMETYYQGGI